jgi:hypothetical protein
MAVDRDADARSFVTESGHQLYVTSTLPCVGLPGVLRSKPPSQRRNEDSGAKGTRTPDLLVRRFRLVEGGARLGELSVHCVHPDHGHDVREHTWGTRLHPHLLICLRQAFIPSQTAIQGSDIDSAGFQWVRVCRLRGRFASFRA